MICSASRSSRQTGSTSRRPPPPWWRKRRPGTAAAAPAANASANCCGVSGRAQSEKCGVALEHELCHCGNQVSDSDAVVRSRSIGPSLVGPEDERSVRHRGSILCVKPHATAGLRSRASQPLCGGCGAGHSHAATIPPGCPGASWAALVRGKSPLWAAAVAAGACLPCWAALARQPIWRLPVLRLPEAAHERLDSRRQQEAPHLHSDTCSSPAAFHSCIWLVAASASAGAGLTFPGGEDRLQNGWPRDGQRFDPSWPASRS